jgi:hypothetical protein
VRDVIPDDEDTDEIPEVPWQIRLGFGAFALMVCVGFLVYGQCGAPTSASEQRWVANLRQLGIDDAEAERLAAEVRRGAAKPHGETGNLSEDVANYQDDVAHMAAIYWWHAREDGRAAHATTWRKWATVPGAIAAVALLLAWVGFRRRRRA